MLKRIRGGFSRGSLCAWEHQALHWTVTFPWLGCGAGVLLGSGGAGCCVSWSLSPAADDTGMIFPLNCLKELRGGGEDGNQGVVKSASPHLGIMKCLVKQ